MKSNKNNSYQNIDNSAVLLELGTLAFKNNIPLFTTLELTQDCNFKCSHCYNFDRSVPQRVTTGGSPLTTSEWFNVIDQIMLEGAFYICFTGGEVFLYPHLWEMVERVNANNGLVKLKSNGASLTDDNVERIIKSRISSLEISIYGMCEETYHKFTHKKGMFQKVVDGLERLKGNGVSVILNFILTRDNVNELPEMVEFAEKLNFPFNVSDEITKRYDQTDTSLDFNITDEQYSELLNGPFSHYFSIKHDLKDHSFQCACARNVCGIGYNGDIFPCIGAPIKVGNIKESAFTEVWNNAEFFKKLRTVTNQEFKECVKCDVAQFCNRSSGSTFVNTDDYYGCDPTSLRIAKIRKAHVVK